MKKVLLSLLVIGVLVLGMTAFAAEEAVVDDDMLIVEEIQGDVMPIAETTEGVAVETEEVAEGATEETATVEEAKEEVTEEATEAVTEEVVEIDVETLVKNAVFFEGKQLDFAEGMGEMIEKDGVLMVPVRVLLEAAGYQVSWSPKEQMVMGANQTSGAMVVLQINNENLFYLSAEGEEGKVVMAAPAFLNVEESRTYVPLNEIAQATGYKLNFDAETKMITLSK